MSENKMNKSNKNQKEAEVKETADVITDNDSVNEGNTEKKEKPAEPEVDQTKKKKEKKDHKEAHCLELEEKLRELADKHIRLQAEFDNFRKRTVKEKTELIKSGGERVLTGILPIIDDFERAISSLKEVPGDDPGKQGTLLIYSKFKEFLKLNSVNEIEALHQNFDVDHHEALSKIPANDENMKGKVIEVIQKGYTLNDKVIRYAKVVVGE